MNKPNIQVRIVDHGYAGPKTIECMKTEALDEVGSLASQFVDRWGMVAGLPDGEDSSGRAKLRLATVQETVDRAFAMAEEIYSQARIRGRIIDIPNMNQINADYDQDRAEERQKEFERKASRRA